MIYSKTFKEESDRILSDAVKRASAKAREAYRKYKEGNHNITNPKNYFWEGCPTWHKVLPKPWMELKAIIQVENDLIQLEVKRRFYFEHQIGKVCPVCGDEALSHISYEEHRFCTFTCKGQFLSEESKLNY